MLEKEDVDGGCWRARDVEEEGGAKIGMPMVDDDDDGGALLTIQGELEGAVNAPRNPAVRPLQPPLAPTPPKTNISLARSTHAP